MAKKFVLFDLDGTMIDSRPGILEGVAHALCRMGIKIKPTEVTTNVIGPPLFDAFHNYYGLSEKDATQAVAFYREYYKQGALFNNILYGGILPMLASLKGVGLSLYLATGKPLCFSRPICERFGIAPFMTDFFATELDGRFADKPSLLAHVLRCTGQDAADGVMVGDRRYDIEGASANGMDSVGVLWGFGGEEELRKAGATHLAATAEELAKIILSL